MTNLSPTKLCFVNTWLSYLQPFAYQLSVSITPLKLTKLKSGWDFLLKLSFHLKKILSRQNILNFIDMTISIILLLLTVKWKHKAFEIFQFICVIVGFLWANISSTVSAEPNSPLTWLTVNYCYLVCL